MMRVAVVALVALFAVGNAAALNPVEAAMATPELSTLVSCGGRVGPVWGHLPGRKPKALAGQGHVRVRARAGAPLVCRSPPSRSSPR